MKSRAHSWTQRAAESRIAAPIITALLGIVWQTGFVFGQYLRPCAANLKYPDGASAAWAITTVNFAPFVLPLSILIGLAIGSIPAFVVICTRWPRTRRGWAYYSLIALALIGLSVVIGYAPWLHNSAIRCT
jgi:hypothetical protein